MSKPGERTALLIGTSASAASSLAPIRDLVGRERELEAMTEALHTHTAGVRTIMVTGAAGVGKSALLRRFLQIARSEATLVSTGCMELDASLPLAPFRALIDRLMRLSPHAAESAAVVRKQLDAIRPEGPGGVERSLIVSAWARLVSAAAEREPLVIAIDDLHWADHTTLDVFGYLARRIADRDVLLVATTRSTEDGRAADALVLRDELRRHEVAVSIELGPLALDGTRGMIRAAFELDRSPDRDFATRLHRHARGNALLTEEILRDLVARGVVFRRADGWYRTEPLWDEIAPRSVLSTVAHRLETMDPESADVLTAAAILGEQFDCDALARLTAAAGDVIVTAMKRGTAAQLIEQAPSDPSMYRFRHALLRDAVEQRLFAPERAALHGRAASILLDHSTNAELAHHYDLAGDIEHAIGYHVRAALEAQGGFAFGDALRHAERVLDLATRPGLGDFFVRIMPSVLDHAGTIRMQRYAERARDYYAAAGDALHYGRCIAWLGHCRGELGDLEGDVAAQREAIRVLEPLGDSIHLVNALANLAPWTELPEALELAQRALAVADRIGAVRERARAREVMALALLRSGRVAEGHDAMRELVAIVREGAGSPQAPYFLGVDFLHRASAILALIPGTADERRAVVDDAVERAHVRGIRRGHVVLSEFERAFAEGDWDAALALGDEFTGMGSDTLRSRVHAAQAVWMRLMRGDPSVDASAVEAVYEGAANLMKWVIEPQWLCAIALAMDDPRRALAVAEPLYARMNNAHANAAAVYALSAARIAGDTEAFERWSTVRYRDAVQEAPAVRAYLAFAAAERALRDDCSADALPLLGESAERFAEFGDRIVELFVRIRRIEVLASSGDVALATAELAPVLEYWKRAKATAQLARLRGRLEPLGLAVRVDAASARGSHTSHGTLSAREREVAVLVGEGFTNKEIAERLGVSVRTAESHVEQIRSKLGFRSRAQIAKWIAQRDPPALSEHVR